LIVPLLAPGFVVVPSLASVGAWRCATYSVMSAVRDGGDRLATEHDRRDGQHHVSRPSRPKIRRDQRTIT
jgi:hypothetical protein